MEIYNNIAELKTDKSSKLRIRLVIFYGEMSDLVQLGRSLNSRPPRGANLSDMKLRHVWPLQISFLIYYIFTAIY